MCGAGFSFASSLRRFRLKVMKKFQFKRAWVVVRNSTRDVLKDMRESDIQLLASSLAFATVISIVPLLAVSLSVFHAYGGFDVLFRQIEPFILQNIVSGSGASEVSGALQSAIRRIHSGTLGVGGVIFLLVASTKLFHDMEMAVQRIWNLKTKRSLWKRLTVYWLTMFLGPLALAAALGALSSKNVLSGGIISRRLLTVMFEFLAFFAIYKLVPNTVVKIRYAFLSAVTATACVIGAQNIYTTITRKILSYNKVYGSLASVPIFLIWILVLWWICLAGVALTASLQNQLSDKKN